MIEIVNYNKLGTCPFCDSYPTLREFNREPSYLYCANDECPISDVRISLDDWKESKNRKSNVRVENKIWQKQAQVLIWILSWIPLMISFGGLFLSNESRPFMLLIPFGIVETFLTTMLVWRTK